MKTMCERRFRLSFPASCLRQAWQKVFVFRRESLPAVSFPGGPRSGFRGAAAVAVFLLGTVVLQAANSTWLNIGADFNADGNWSAGVPGANDQAIFDSPMVVNPFLGASHSIGQLNFSAADAAGYTLAAAAGQVLTLSSATAISSGNSAGTNTIAADLILAGGKTKSIVQSGRGTLALHGSIGEDTPGTAVTFARVSNAFPVFVLTGQNTFSGNATIADGTLLASSLGSMGVAGALGTGEKIVLGNVTTPSSRGVTLIYTGPGETSDKVLHIGAGSGDRVISTAGATGGLVLTADIVISCAANLLLTLKGDSAGNVLAGRIGNPAGYVTSIIKKDSGCWALAGDNTYSGPTTVDSGGGTLLVNGDQSAATGAVTVAAGGTLGGGGTVGGNTAIQKNGRIRPGTEAAPGMLTFGGDLLLANGATAAFRGGSTIAVAGQLTLGNDNWTLRLEEGFRDGGSTTLITYGTLAADSGLAPVFDTADLGFTPSRPLSLTDTGGSIVLKGVRVPREGATVLILR